MKQLRVLVVDDEYWVCENLRTILAGFGVALTVLEPAHDGEAALVRLESDRPDLVITDIDMPLMCGNELIRKIKRDYPAVQTVVLSGYADFSYVREALLDGALDYLLKPVSPESLQAVVTKVSEVVKGRWVEDQSAVSQLEDVAMTALLQEPGFVSVLDDAPHLNLSYDVFTLLLVRLGELARSSWNHQGDPKVFALHVKGLITRELSGNGNHTVFQNQLCRNEFLVLTDQDSNKVDHIALRLGENLGKLLGTKVDVAISLPFYTLAKLNNAYQDTRSALFARTADATLPVHYAEVKARPFQGRILPEQEKRLAHAAATQDVALIQKIVLDEIGLRSADRWLLAEILQTAVYLAGFLMQRAPLMPAARLSLVHETYLGQLSQAVQRRNLKEVCTLMEGWIDELFGNEPNPKSASVSMRQTVKRVSEIIEEHYFDDLSLASLAETFRVDSSYLSKAFKQVTGTNLMAAIAKRRIEKAKEYIQDRRLALVEVASLVGYEEYAYFNRVFHKVEGVSPTEYRTSVGRSA